MAQTNHWLPTATGNASNSWTNPSNAFINDDTFATAASINQKQDYYNFNIEEIPKDATIVGIEIRTRAMASDSSGGTDTVDLEVDISHNQGSNYTTAKVNQFNDITVPFLGHSVEPQTKVFGSPTDTWGRSWTPAEFRNGAFMARVNFDAQTNSSTPKLYFIAVTVYYSQVEFIDGKRKRVVLTASSNSGYIQSIDTTVNDNDFERVPYGLDLSTGNGLRVGFRNKSSSPATGDEFQAEWQSFIEFDTSSIPDTAKIRSAYVRIYSSDGAYNDASIFDTFLVGRDYGASVTTADWILPETMSSLEKKAILDNLLFSADENQLLSTKDLIGFINKSGTSRFALLTTDQLESNYPTNSDNIEVDHHNYLILADFDADLYKRPEIVIEYEEEITFSSDVRDKQYVTRLYDKDDNYIGPLNKVSGIPTQRDEINTLGQNTTIDLSITREEIPEGLIIGSIITIIEYDDIFPDGIGIFKGRVFEILAPDSKEDKGVSINLEAITALAENEQFSIPYVADSYVLNDPVGTIAIAGSNNRAAISFEYTSDADIVQLTFPGQTLNNLGAISVYSDLAGKPNEELLRIKGSQLYTSTSVELIKNKPPLPTYNLLIQIAVAQIPDPVNITANKKYWLVFEGGLTPARFDTPSTNGLVSSDSGSTWAVSDNVPGYFTIDFGGESTTIPYEAKDPGVMLFDILNKYKAIGGQIEFDGGSILYTGQALDYIFKGMNYLQAIMKILEILPPFYYVRFDFITNKLYILNRTDLPDIYIDNLQNIEYLNETVNDETITNVAYFSGAEDLETGENLYLKRVNKASKNRFGTYSKPINDISVESLETAKAMADRVVAEGGDQNLSVETVLTDVPISFSAGLCLPYTIEQIKPGMMIAPINIGSEGQQRFDHTLFDDQYFDYKLHDPNTYCLVVNSIELGRSGIKIILGAPRQELQLESNRRTDNDLEQIIVKANPTRPRK